MESGTNLTTIKRSKFGTFFCMAILIALTVLCILKRELFMYSDTVISIKFGKAVAEEVKRISFPLILFVAAIYSFTIYFLQLNLRWKLTYSESGFSLPYEDIDWIDFSKIKRIQHYVFRGRRNGSNKFIIEYLGLAEFGVKEELLETTISKFPNNDEMKIFFSTIKKNCPQIEFYTTIADSSGMKNYDFDFFPIIDDGFLNCGEHSQVF